MIEEGATLVGRMGCVNEPVLRASLGQLSFDGSIDPAGRQRVQQMWRTRLDGYARRDLRRYLSGNDSATLYIQNGRRFTFPMFRLFCRAVLFPVRRMMSPMGVDLNAEVIDGMVNRNGPNYVTRGILVLSLGRRVIRQSRLTMTLGPRDGRWVWLEAHDEPMKRVEWNRRLGSGGTNGGVAVGAGG